ncbi:MAG: histidinol phosphate phosphatase domain-containing protein [Anaerolineae bacterium]|nr:histidinol phosphate phosphatase domain-containing protein [Anaerolineae bacterium]
MDENARVDLHTHSFLSDGALLPSEQLRHALVRGLGAIAITDHADDSNMEPLLRQLLEFAESGARAFDLAFIPGVELTHVPPADIGRLARRARRLGARLVVVHGETLVEPVAPGTNRAAVEAPGVDILAHPGLITEEEAAMAAANGVALELSARQGHSLTNGHVARVARATGAHLVVNSDGHSPSNLIDQTFARLVARGAGLDDDEVYAALVTNPWAIVARATGHWSRDTAARLQSI